LLDEEGRAYVLALRERMPPADVDRLTLEADDTAHFLEKLAARWEMHLRFPSSAPASVATALGAELARRLSLSMLEEASDAVSQVFCDEHLWVWNRPAIGPNDPSTWLLGRDAERTADALAALRTLAPTATIAIHTDLPGGSDLREATGKRSLLGVQEDDG
jgi:hypothetical protein